MPTVTFFTEGKTVTCPEGANLREAAIQAGVSVYKGPAKLLNCRGRGMCGTCKVSIEPLKNVSPPTELERRHPVLGHSHIWANVRLSCQARVYGDIQVATMT
jgi:ferredoxin